MRQLASYVSATANSNLEKLMRSGFPVHKTDRTPIGPLLAPEAPVVSQRPVPGTLAAASSPVYGASSYNWSQALATAPEADVQTAQTTGARVSFAGLTPGTIYAVCLNAAGISDWSDSGSLMVVSARDGPSLTKRRARTWARRFVFRQRAVSEGGGFSLLVHRSVSSKVPPSGNINPCFPIPDLGIS